MTARLLLASTVVMLLIAADATAQTVRNRVELLPGGRTIAGPGAQKDLPVEDSVFVLGGFLPDVCMTVANQGDAGTVGIQSVETGGIFVRFTVDPGETGTRCYRTDNLFNLSLVCLQGRTTSGPCNFLWRADRR